MPGKSLYGKGGTKNPDLQENAHQPGYKWDSKMEIWYKPLIPLAKKKKRDNLKIA